MTKTWITRAILAAFTAGIFNVQVPLNAAAANARVSVRTGPAAPTVAVPALNPTALPQLSAPALTVAPALKSALVTAPAVAPSAEAKAPAAAQAVLSAASADAAAAAAPSASAAAQKETLSKAFDASKPAEPKADAVPASVSAAPAPALAPASARSAGKNFTSIEVVSGMKKGKGAPSWKKKLLTNGLLVAGASGLAYAAHAFGLGEAALGLMPMAAVLGSLQPGQEPSDDQALSFYKGLQSLVPAGEYVTSDAMEMAAEEANIGKPTAVALIKKLAAQGRVAVFDNGKVVMTDFADRIKNPDESQQVAAADQHAYEAVRLINTASVDNHARAVAMLDKVTKVYDYVQRKEGETLEQRSQALVLKNNAKLELLSDYLGEFDSVLAKEEATRPNVANTRIQIQSAQEWIKRSRFSAHQTPEMLDENSHAWLVKIIGTLSPEKHLSKQNGQEIAAGIRILKTFVDGLGPEASASAGSQDQGREAPKMLPAPKDEAPAQPAKFKPIPKGDDRAKTLYEFGTNLTAIAAEGTMTPLIGRKAEIRQMVKTLLRVEKNNPVVIGDKGVGKTAIVSGLAQMIVSGEIPELAGKNIFQLNLTKIIAGTKYRGEFEERMQKIMDEVKKSNGQIILFIDEIHRILGAGSSEGGNDASQILKDSLSTGELAVIGATTLTEYRKIEKDGALSRRFNAVKLAPPTPAEAVEIVDGIKSRYEKKHNVVIPAETVKEAVATATRYITDRNLPDSVLDLIDDAAAEVELQASEKTSPRADRTVTAQDIAFEISLRTGIPAGSVSADDLALLQSLPDELKKRLVGQDKAVEAVVRAIRRGRLGYRDPKKPVGVFALLGPTGVGKTHLARTIARHLFRSEKNMVRIDMSEYKEKHNMSRLVGAPPGYVGFEGEGELTEKVRRNPHSVVLFDEIDKAHPEVLDLLLQILDDGVITDSQGRKIDFSHTIIMMSANTGGSLGAAMAERAQKRRPMGFITYEEKPEPEQKAAEGGEREQSYIDAFKAATRPEFFNRIGKRNVIVFNELTRPDLTKILEIAISDLNERLKHKEMTLEMTGAAKKFILDDASNEENRAYGARPLNQAMENDVETALVDAELSGAIKNGDAVVVDVKDGKVVASRKN